MKNNLIRGTIIVLTAGLLATGAIAARKNWEERFNRLDTDKDGKISQQEMKVGRIAHFKEMDKNGDGMVTKEEHKAFVFAKMEPRLDKRFQKMDTDNDGEISAEEFAAKKQARHFNRMDVDGDGMISRDEAEKAAKKRHGKMRN
jgi:hypothetical protein